MRHISPTAPRIAALAGVALLAAAAAAAFHGMRGLDEALRVERLALRVIVAVQDLRARLQESVAVQRQFLLTGDATLIARLAGLREGLRSGIADLERLVEQPEQRATLPALGSALEEALAGADAAIQARQREGAERAVQAALSVSVAALAGRAERLAEAFEKRHRRILAEREGATAGDIRFVERAVLAGGALAVLLLGWSLRAARRHDSARRAAEASLEARSRELRLVIDAVPAMISYVDAGERYLFHNRAYEQWLDLPGARIDGRTVREVLGEQVYAVAGPALRQALSGEVVRYERQERFADGRVLDLAIAYVPHFRPDGAVLGCYALLTDISELKRLERLKDWFVAMVSHELRTPITAIRGALGMLAADAAGALPETARELAAIANSSSERLARLVEDILAIQGMESGELRLDLGARDLSRLLQQALIAAAPAAARRGIRLEPKNVPIGAPARTDGNRVLQVLSNLLSNAIQFSPEGGLVELALEQRGAAFRFTLRDHGPGVSEAFRPRLFERFAQETSAARGSSGRFGLGLAIAKMLVERLGGRIGYDPAPGGGASFWFELPGQAPGAGTAGC